VFVPLRGDFPVQRQAFEHAATHGGVRDLGDAPLQLGHRQLELARRARISWRRRGGALRWLACSWASSVASAASTIALPSTGRCASSAAIALAKASFGSSGSAIGRLSD